MRASRREGGGGGWLVLQGGLGLYRLKAGHARGAHVKHGLRARDAGRVEAQRLVERRRALPSTKRKHRRRGDMRASRRKGIRKRRWCKQRAGRARLWRLRAGHARGAHEKHELHAPDAERVEAQRLVERYQLPSRKGNHRRRDDMRASRRKGGVGWSVAQAAGRPRTVEAEGRARARSAPETSSPCL